MTKLQEKRLQTISLDALLESLDQAKIDSNSATKLLEFVGGLTLDQQDHLSLPTLDAIGIAPKFKDLAVLGMILVDAPTISPEEMGANLRETFKKMPALEALVTENLEDKRAVPTPKIDFGRAAENLMELSHEASWVNEKMRAWASENTDVPTGFMIHVLNGETIASAMFKEAPEKDEGRFPYLPDMQLAKANDRDSVYYVNIEGIDTASLEQLLDDLPEEKPIGAAASGMFALIGDQGPFRLRDLVQRELNKRESVATATIFGLIREVNDIEADQQDSPNEDRALGIGL